MPGYHVINLGCKVNRVESDDVEALFSIGSYVPVPLDEADIVVVNTCTVTAEAEKKTRKAVHRALRCSNARHIIITGCSSAIRPDEYSAMDDRVTVVPKARLYPVLGAMLGNGEALDLSLRSTGGRCRIGIKVQDGCNNACTYCIVHVARGRSASVDYRVIGRQFQSYLDQGIPEIVLTGINLGAYDFEGMRLSQLIEALLSRIGFADDGTPLSRIRISSIEPMDVTPDLIRVLATADDRLCKHLHLPLQSGSTKVLREMNRPYSAQDFLDLVTTLYREVPSLSLSTDIIVGFPGETEDEFLETLEMSRKCRFSRIHVFPYSPREGTPAASRADQVSPAEKGARARMLRELGETIRLSAWEDRVATCEVAVVEQRGRAVTDSYFTVECDEGLPVATLQRIPLVSRSN